MGTGRSGIPKGVKRTKLKGDLRVRSRSMGYDLTMSDDTVDKYKSSLNRVFDELNKFQTSMRETDDIILAAGGTLSIEQLKSNVLGDTDDDGNVRINSSYIDSPNDVDNTLPHEHTHNLVHTLITKELGYAKGTPEFRAAYRDAIIEHSLNVEALEKYKRYMTRVYDADAADARKLLNNLAISGDSMMRSIAESMLDKAIRNKQDLANLTIEQASKKSGMRSYATRQYSWAPTGHYIEMPTVATEMFYKHGYNFKSLLENSPYSYFVLQSLYGRLHKGKKKKK